MLACKNFGRTVSQCSDHYSQINLRWENIGASWGSVSPPVCKPYLGSRVSLMSQSPKLCELELKPELLTVVLQPAGMAIFALGEHNVFFRWLNVNRKQCLTDINEVALYTHVGYCD